MQFRSNNLYSKIILSSVSGPVLWQNISDIRSKFTIVSATLGSTNTVTVPAGNYSITELMAAVIVQLNTLLGGVWTYLLTADDRVSLTAPVGETFTIVPSATDLSKYLGYTQTVAEANNIIAEHPYNIVMECVELRLTSDLFSQSCYYEPIGNNNILLQTSEWRILVPVNALYGENMVFIPGNSAGFEYRFKRPVKISSLKMGFFETMSVNRRIDNRGGDIHVSFMLKE